VRAVTGSHHGDGAMNGEFTWTTLDEERNHFTTLPPYGLPPPVQGDYSVMPSGVYRVVDGELHRIISGVNPDLEKR